MKAITFSRFFPATHPRKGEPTFFIEKIWKSMYDNGKCPSVLDDYINNYVAALKCDLANYNDIHKKSHTIRSGNRWKVGDKFSPRVWGDDINPKSGRKGAYHSKQIEIAPPIEIKKIWEFQKDLLSDEWYLDGKQLSSTQRIDLAINDGLLYKDMLEWFNKPFIGQIICWNEHINY